MTEEVIAIDGPAASGKSTVAVEIAERLGIPYINTGNMYRAVAWYALENGFNFEKLDEEQIKPMLDSIRLDYKPTGDNNEFILTLNGQNIMDRIRTPEVASGASKVGTMSIVRQWLIDIQRSQKCHGLIVMEGRDIGTVIFPNAKYKFYVTASPEVRAKRRLAQTGEVAETATLETLIAEIAERDKTDMSRKIAPLKQADDAIFIDTSDLTIDEVVESILSKVEGKRANEKN